MLQFLVFSKDYMTIWTFVYCVFARINIERNEAATTCTSEKVETIILIARK